ncbi:MAG TPA: hypothetical protein VN445_11470 [Rectinemataceae bacterium]|nr:hypothetical protein [Rectinemataceae bacterium]
MKRAFFVAVCAIILATNAFAQTSLSGLSPKEARSMGMGGSFKVFATGYQAFFGNPAGFSGPGTLTLADIATWAYLRPSPANIRDLVEIGLGEVTQAETEASLGRLIAENGFGGGASVGMGWSGKGLGLGLTMISDSLATGASYSDSLTTVRSQVNGIFGMAWPLEFGPLKMSFGADVRVFYRLDSSGDWPFSTLASAMLNGQSYSADIAALSVKGGYGLAVDTGATVVLGPLSAGVMIRDYGYKFFMGNSTVGDIMDTFSAPLDGSDEYALEPIYTAGLGLNFKNGSALAYSFYAEADDPMNFLSEATVDFESSLDLLHVGAELKILHFLALRAGFNEGLVSIGAGLDFALFEVDMAAFSEKITGVAEGSGRSGIALQAAVRF